MEFDLQRGLRDLSAAPPVAPDAVPTDRVLARVHRVRALRATAIGAAGLALVAGAAVAVVALPRDPMPPVYTPAPTVTPTPTPTPTQSPAPSPTPTPTPTQTPEPIDPPIVALTDTGALVLVDPGTGAVTRTVYEGLSTTDPGKIALTVSPDRTFAYVSQVVSTDGGTAREILRISLADGSAELVAEGMQPAISPDGRTLAYAGVDPNVPAEEGLALVLRDLATGAERYIPSGYGANPAAWLGQVAWSRDSDTLFVPRGMEGSSLFAMDAGASSFEQATEVGEDAAIHTSEAVVLADGALLATCSPYDGLPEDAYVAVIDPLSGSVTAHVEPLSGRYIADVAAHPTARGVAFLWGASTFPSPEQVTWDLYRWDDGAEPRLLATGFIAVAW